ncbi:hypothetical protein H710_00383 [Bartonella bacilliformis Ver097]|uniref:Uncharacterized protein n=1 Tax=Bartonella bacilliformis Ver097 TaxID=1293911 RepID=A0A072R630_BARBA|nr:hypothetical protein H710_00383 [Bartonella bacilliformis Ver097]
MPHILAGPLPATLSSPPSRGLILSQSQGPLARTLHFPFHKPLLTSQTPFSHQSFPSQTQPSSLTSPALPYQKAQLPLFLQATYLRLLISNLALFIGKAYASLRKSTPTLPRALCFLRNTFYLEEIKKITEIISQGLHSTFCLFL